MITLPPTASLLLPFLAMSLLVVHPAAGQEAVPVLKDGNCPTGYSTSGTYCVPGKNAHFAIMKAGNCPAGYTTSGKYCVAGTKARLIILKQGACPTGFRTDGQYCVKNK